MFLAKRGVENELTGHFVMLTDVGTHLILRISCFGSFNRFWIFAVSRLRLLFVFWFVCLAFFFVFCFLGKSLLPLHIWQFSTNPRRYLVSAT